MNGLREAFHEAATRDEPPLGFDPAAALRQGRLRRRRRYLFVIAGATTAVTVAAAGAVAATVGSGGGRTSVVTTTPSPTTHNTQPSPSGVFSPSPLGPHGPACGQFDATIAQVAYDTLPRVGTWGPVSAAPGLCRSNFRSFSVTVHIGDKVGWLDVVISPGTPRPCPPSSGTATSTGGFVTVQPGTVTCRSLPEGQLIATDKSTTTTRGQQMPIESADATLFLKNGIMIDAFTTGEPDEQGPAPVGTEPYTGSDLTRLVTALAQNAVMAQLTPTPTPSTS